MREKSLEKICFTTCKVVEQVAEYIREQIGQVSADQIDHKSLNSLVSHVDKTAEESLISKLLQIVPEAGIIAEESETQNPDAAYKWIIDPLDGTTNFLHQLPFFAISVGLMHENQMVVGVVLDVVHNDIFYAWKGGGAFMNGAPIRVSDNSDLSQCLVATGFPYYNFDWMESYLRCFNYFMRKTRGVRRIGSAALDLAYVACGRFDFYFEYSLQKWDMAAGVLLVTEAGGVVTDLKGQNRFLDNGSVIACNKLVYPKVLEVIKPEFEKYD
ncbi:MAG: inositol monophosphatase [Saprospiraceae bacterium]|jgi:myo-inositol-1(or 4)-monophosphatase|nr:inositol monophosphatase [Saprospiraceae bacterium]